jgi:hypothetical protein
LGDVLGTILRDPHYILTQSGEVVSIHNYELFHDIGGFRFGFVEPTFLALWRHLRGAQPGEDRTLLRRMVEEYRTAYIEKRQAIQGRWGDLEAYFVAHQQAIQEYVRQDQDWRSVVAAVRDRAFRDPDRWVQTLLEAYRGSHPELPEA